MSSPPSLPTLAALLVASPSPHPPAVPELHHLAAVAAAQPRHVPRILSPDPLLPTGQPGPTTIYPSLLSSLAAHRLPRPTPPTSHPRIVRSTSGTSPSAAPPTTTGTAHRQPSHSPSPRRASHSSAVPSPPHIPAHSPAPTAHDSRQQNYFIKPRGPSYLSTLPAPGFPLPSYLSHTAFRSVLHTSAFSSGEQKPAEYVVPAPPGQASNGAVGAQGSSRRVARHSDSDTSPTPTRRRARSGPLPSAPGTPSLPHQPTTPSAASSSATSYFPPSPTAPLYLPTKFSESDHSPSLSLSPDGLTLSYTGVTSSGGTDRDAASARSDHPIPPHVGVYYFEIEVLDKGVSGFISIGLCTREMNLGRLPGWERDSWGYHGDDGHCFAWTASDMEYGPKFTTGDVVGCGIDYATGQAFYTKNGLFLGPVFESLPSSGPLFACIGLRSSSEVIRANFGQKDFVYDIDGYVRRRKESVQREVGRWGVKSAGLGYGEAEGVKVVFLGTGETGEDAAAAAVSRGRRRLTVTDGPTASAGPGTSAKKEKTPKTKKDSVSEAFYGHGAEGSSSGRHGWRTADEEAKQAEELKLALDTLVLDYVSNAGYASTALALAGAMRARSAPSAADGMDVDHHHHHHTHHAARREPGAVYPVLPVDLVMRRKHVAEAIRRGDVDDACREIGEGWPWLVSVTFPAPVRDKDDEGEGDGEGEEEEEDTGMEDPPSEGWKGMEVLGHGLEGKELACRLECRKFVELVLRSSSPSLPAEPQPSTSHHSTPHAHALPPSELAPAPTPPTPELSRAIAYGQHLYHKYASSPAAAAVAAASASESGSGGHLVALVEKTFGVLAYARPLDAAGEVGELVRDGARGELAEWVGGVLLRAEGRNDRPALARAWAGAKVAMAQLVALGQGKAAYLDVDEEYAAPVRRGGP